MHYSMHHSMMLGSFDWSSTMKTRPFKQVDVFTQTPFCGNPVAVVLDAKGLTTEQMQHIAAWTNLSETTFVLPPTTDQADYQLRIFTPRQELPFAGHPTIGSAHAVIESGIATVKAGTVRQECLAGIISLSVQETPSGQKILAQAPPAAVTPIENDVLEVLTEALESTLVQMPLRIDVGAVWIVADLATADAVAQLKPNTALLTEISRLTQATGITVFGKAEDGLAQMHVRSFAPAQGILEDPVCGSGNVSVAAFLAHTGLIKTYGADYIARQGMQVGRDGQIFIKIGERQIEFGGYAVTCIDGTVSID
jgi:PhzF family phenazine biosynthesis protein